MKVGLVQVTSSDDPRVSLNRLCVLVTEAVDKGAEFVLTPEVSNVVSSSRRWQEEVLCYEDDDPVLSALRICASQHGIWLLIGSLALKTNDQDGRFANRSFLISPDGEIVARYDKIHMFDVRVSDTESYRESASYRPGSSAVLARTPIATIGMTICYDLRFPHLYSALAQASAQILCVPAAFTVPTGQAHWEVLLRARAIETGCFVLAPAQVGTHVASDGRERKTYGHSLVIDPWGKVLADGGTEPGVVIAELDLTEVDNIRSRIPTLSHHVPFDRP